MLDCSNSEYVQSISYNDSKCEVALDYDGWKTYYGCNATHRYSAGLSKTV